MAGQKEEHQFVRLHTNHVTSVLRVSLQATFVAVAGTLAARVERSHYTSLCRRDWWYCNGHSGALLSIGGMAPCIPDLGVDAG